MTRTTSPATADLPPAARAPAGGWTAFPWHPALFALAIAVSFWMDAAVSPYAAARTVAGAVGVVVVLLLVFATLVRSAQMGGVLTSLVLAALWSKHIIEFAGATVGRLGPAFGLLWIAAILLALALGWRIARPKLRTVTMGHVTSALNRVALLLLAATILLAILNGRAGGALADVDQGSTLGTLSTSTSTGDGAASDLPDVYAILLDGYPREDVLDYAFGLDNGPFLASLERRGFSVASRAHSPYLWTHVTVPAVLNMAYVEDIPSMVDVIEGRAPRQPTLRRAVADGVAFDVAREHGYTTISVGGGFEEVATRQTDVWIDGGQLSDFELNFLMSTYAGDLVRWTMPDMPSAQHRSRVVYNLEVLGEIAAGDASSPRFVFAHVPSPHAPIVFGPDGSPVTAPLTTDFYADSPVEAGGDVEEFRDRYRDQLPHLNELILESIDRIIANSPSPPVIILFADHGSASTVDWTETLPSETSPARVLERTGILFAALTPRNSVRYPDATTVVDLYRVLFDEYLGTDYGLASPPPDGGQIEPVDPGVLDR